MNCTRLSTNLGSSSLAIHRLKNVGRFAKTKVQDWVPLLGRAQLPPAQKSSHYFFWMNKRLIANVQYFFSLLAGFSMFSGFVFLSELA